MYLIKLQDGRWIKVSENIYKMWLGEKKQKAIKLQNIPKHSNNIFKK